jgi:L-lactate dehydrogenase complex protein LldG
VAYTHQIVPNIKQGLQWVVSENNGTNLPSMINLNTGPSRTADIEKTLVLGAHGPKEVYLFLIDINLIEIQK